MKAADGYILKCLCGQFYIMPVGQKIADNGRCIKINNSGRVIWQHLSDEISLDELLCLVAKDFHCENDTQFKQDIEQFLHMLQHFGMLAANGSEDQQVCQTYAIGGFHMIYTGKSIWLHPHLNTFLLPKTQAAPDNPPIAVQHWHVKPLSAVTPFCGRLVLFNHQMDIYDCGDRFVLRFHANKHLSMCHLSKDGLSAVFYYDGCELQEGINELFYGFRAAFFYLAAQHGRFALHAASICYNGSAWLFSASAGTGKSTHIQHWIQLFSVTAINGDINLMGIEDKTVYIYGTPWCGTSGIYDSLKYPVGGIILLKRMNTDYVEQLYDDQKQLLVSQRMISPAWTAELLEQILKFCGTLLEKIPIFRLCCTKEEHAAIVMKSYIDQYNLGDLTTNEAND